jgi:hypothetical protein
MPGGTTGRTVEQKWDLLGAGQDSYAGQNAQDPRTSRKIQSWIVQDDGQLHRELPEPFYTSNTLPGPIAGLYEFDQNNGQGAVERFYFCAARTNSTVGTQNCLFYQYVTATTAWTQVTQVGTLANAPQCVTQENNFFLDDGVSNWLFDGSIWVQNGINFPLNSPAINNTGTGTQQVYIYNQATTSPIVPAGVSVYFYAANGNGSAAYLAYPTLTSNALASISNSVNPTLEFNFPGGQATDPSTNPMQWNVRTPSTGVLASTTITLPYPSGGGAYQMAVITALVIPSAGQYTVTLQHDDGAYFGFGSGINTGTVPSSSGGASPNAPPTTGILGLSNIGGNDVGGYNTDTINIYFGEADIYPLEINYSQFQGQQCLGFSILPSGSSFAPGGSTTINSRPFILSGAAGTGLNAVLGRYYWFDNADQTPGVATESSTSPITPESTGPVINGATAVYQQPGLFVTSTASMTVTAFNSTDNPGPINPQLNGSMVGQVLYVDGTKIGTIASVGTGNSLAAMKITAVSNPSPVVLANGTVVDYSTYSYTYTPASNTVFAPPGANGGLVGVAISATGFTNVSNNLTAALVLESTNTYFIVNNPNSTVESGDSAVPTTAPNTLTLASTALATVSTNGRAVICDARCTHWNVYASESDGSKIGQYLFSVPVTQNLASNPYIDTSPFINSPSNTFLPIYRPLRNDRPVPSKILTVHKVRQFRRVESSPNFFAFTANEEVTAGNNGDPAQCLPGSNINTVSDMVNEVSFPDQSARLRALISHMDALYMFSEKQCYPLYGQSVDDFAISQMVTFALGAAGRFAGQSTPNGLAFMSYDKRAFLYPTSLYSTYLAQGGAAQSALTEIGKPMRIVFSQIPSSRLDEVVSVHYHYGIRDWWVVSFPTSATSDVPQAWVWDFIGKSWFQLQRGFASLNVLEVSEGALVLIGGGVDGNTYVIDDQTGTYSSSANLPVSTWQPALINFGNEEVAHVVRRLELEFSSELLAKDISITIWLDPVNVDSPGAGRTMHLKPALGACRYSAHLIDDGGAVCQRALIQVQARSSLNSGVVRGIKIYADTAPGFITGANRVGGA